MHSSAERKLDTTLNMYIYAGYSNTSFLLSRRHCFYTAAEKTAKAEIGQQEELTSYPFHTIC